METPGGGGYGNELDDVMDNSDDVNGNGEVIRRKRRRVSDQEAKKFTEKGSVHAYRMMQESA